MGTDLTFETFKVWIETRSQHPDSWRRGQVAFNRLYEIRPDLADSIRGDHSGLDPFYRDENLPAFWEWLEGEWK